MDHNCHFGVKVPEGYRDDWVGETDETRLLEVEPTPLTDSDIPPWLQDTENVIVDETPQPFYYKHRKKLLILNILALVLFATIFIAYKTFNSVLGNASFILTDINDIRLTETGFSVSDICAEVHFEQNGFFDWTSRLNNTQFSVVGPVDILTDESQLMSIEFFPKTFTLQIIGNTWRVELKDIEFDNDGAQLKRFINEKKDSVTISTSISVWGKNIPIKKNLSLSHQIVQGFISSAIELLLDNTIVSGINNFSYAKDVGVKCTVNMEVPVVSNILDGLIMVGFTIDDAFHKFLQINFSTFFTSADLKITIFDIDETLIKEGVVQELVHQLLNGDEEIPPLNFTILGRHIESGPSWLCELCKNITMDFAMQLSKLKYSGKPFEFWKIPMELENLYINPEKGKILIQNRLYLLLQNGFESYEVSTDGQILYSGLDLQFVQNISKVESEKLSVNRGNIIFSVNDPKLSKNIFDDWHHGNNNKAQNMTVNVKSNITSTFYNGELAIQESFMIDIHLLEKIFNSTKPSHDQVELIDMKILDKSSAESSEIRFFIKVLVKSPFYFEHLSNGFREIAMRVGFNDSRVIDLSLLEGAGNDGFMPVDLIVKINANEHKTLSDFETLVSHFISGLPVNLTINSADDNEKTIPECDKRINDFLTSLKAPVNISTDNISGNPDGGSFFIRDTTMHVVSREVEMVLFNPISNSEIIIEILEGQALREGYIIGYLKDPVTWLVGPGIWHSPRAKVEFANPGSVGWGMIEDAIRGDGVLKNLKVKGVIRVLFKQYPEFEGFTINFHSSGQKSGKVRWVF